MSSDLRTAQPARRGGVQKSTTAAENTESAGLLSPWPTTPAALATATAALGTAIRSDDDARTQRVGEVAAAMVEREAPGAPQAIKSEAVIRFAGYLRSADWGDVSSMSLGPKSQDFVINHAPMFRNCGAKGLLSPWKVRHAGVIG